MSSYNNETINEEPWYYCANCLSPKVGYEDSVGADYCCDCGSTSIHEGIFENWEQQYLKRYKRKYVNQPRNIKNSPIYQMSFVELMKKVSDFPRWEDIIKAIYNTNISGLSKADSIVLFFDRLIRDNKLDELRELLYNWKV